MYRKGTLAIGLLIAVLFTQCNQPTKTENEQTNVTDTTKTVAANRAPKQTFRYHAYPMKDSGMTRLKKIYDTSQLNMILALNRVDKAHAAKADILIIPDTVLADIMPYSPFPQRLPFLSNVNKIIFFSYPAEAFGAYEHGKLVRWGPTNMGRKKDQTPTGLTYANWKKEVDTSSVKDEWILKWNVNIFNKEGVGFHEYDLPGYPASHSCLRLLDDDAEYLYNWVDTWIIKGTDDLIAHGTPVVVFGQYPFGKPKPWLALLQNPNALDIKEGDLQNLVQPHMQEIMNEQQKLASASANR